MNKAKKFFSKHDLSSIVASLIAIIAGLILGVILLAATSSVPGTDFPRGLQILLQGPFTTGIQSVGNRLFYCVPLIFTGLSVAVAYKTGLFNIGAPGQFLMGIRCSLLVALNINSIGKPVQGVFVWILALVVGMLAGALWGLIPGALKATLGINEVIICIRTNWIAANRFSWVFEPRTYLHGTGTGKSGYLIKTSVTGNGTPSWGFGELTNNSRLDCSIVIVGVIAILLWLFRNKTALGYSRRACGLNKFSAKYAGRKEKKNIRFAMALAGGLAALGGCFNYLNPAREIKFDSAYAALPSYGFDGIPAALLANCNPIGVLFASLFRRYLSSSGSSLAAAHYNKYYADRIIAVIIYRSGFSRFFIELYRRFKQKKYNTTSKKLFADLTEGLLLTTLPAPDGLRPVEDGLSKDDLTEVAKPNEEEVK